MDLILQLNSSDTLDKVDTDLKRYDSESINLKEFCVTILRHLYGDSSQSSSIEEYVKRMRLLCHIFDSVDADSRGAVHFQDFTNFCLRMGRVLLHSSFAHSATQYRQIGETTSMPLANLFFSTYSQTLFAFDNQSAIVRNFRRNSDYKKKFDLGKLLEEFILAETHSQYVKRSSNPRTILAVTRRYILAATFLGRTGSFVLSTSDSLLIFCGETNDRVEIKTYLRAANPQIGLYYCDVSKVLLSWSSSKLGDNRIYIWDTTKKTFLFEINRHESNILALAEVYLESKEVRPPDGNNRDVGRDFEYIASSSADRKVIVWPLTPLLLDHKGVTWTARDVSPFQLTGHFHSIRSMVYSSTNELLFGAGYDFCLFAWNTWNHSLQFRLEGHLSSLVSVHLAFNPEEVVVTIDVSGMLKVWGVNRDRTSAEKLQSHQIQFENSEYSNEYVKVTQCVTTMMSGYSLAIFASNFKVYYLSCIDTQSESMRPVRGGIGYCERTGRVWSITRYAISQAALRDGLIIRRLNFADLDHKTLKISERDRGGIKEDLKRVRGRSVKYNKNKIKTHTVHSSTSEVKHTRKMQLMSKSKSEVAKSKESDSTTKTTTSVRAGKTVAPSGEGSEKRDNTERNDDFGEDYITSSASDVLGKKVFIGLNSGYVMLLDSSSFGVLKILDKPTRSHLQSQNMDNPDAVVSMKYAERDELLIVAFQRGIIKIYSGVFRMKATNAPRLVEPTTGRSERVIISSLPSADRTIDTFGFYPGGGGGNVPVAGDGNVVRHCNLQLNGRDTVVDIDFSDELNLVAIALKSGMVRVYDYLTLVVKCVFNVPTHDSVAVEITGVRFVPFSHALITSDSSGRLTLWSVKMPNPHWIYTFSPADLFETKIVSLRSTSYRSIAVVECVYWLDHDPGKASLARDKNGDDGTISISEHGNYVIVCGDDAGRIMKVNITEVIKKMNPPDINTRCKKPAPHSSRHIFAHKMVRQDSMTSGLHGLEKHNMRVEITNPEIKSVDEFEDEVGLWVNASDLEALHIWWAHGAGVRLIVPLRDTRTRFRVGLLGYSSQAPDAPPLGVISTSEMGVVKAWDWDGSLLGEMGEATNDDEKMEIRGEEEDDELMRQIMKKSDKKKKRRRGGRVLDEQAVHEELNDEMKELEETRKRVHYSLERNHEVMAILLNAVDFNTLSAARQVIEAPIGWSIGALAAVSSFSAAEMKRTTASAHRHDNDFIGALVTWVIPQITKTCDARDDIAGDSKGYPVAYQAYGYHNCTDKRVAATSSESQEEFNFAGASLEDFMDEEFHVRHFADSISHAPLDFTSTNDAEYESLLETNPFPIDRPTIMSPIENHADEAAVDYVEHVVSAGVEMKNSFQKTWNVKVRFQNFAHALSTRRFNMIQEPHKALGFQEHDFIKTTLLAKELKVQKKFDSLIGDLSPPVAEGDNEIYLSRYAITGDVPVTAIRNKNACLLDVEELMNTRPKTAPALISSFPSPYKDSPSFPSGHSFNEERWYLKNALGQIVVAASPSDEMERAASPSQSVSRQQSLPLLKSSSPTNTRPRAISLEPTSSPTNTSAAVSLFGDVPSPAVKLQRTPSSLFLLKQSICNMSVENQSAVLSRAEKTCKKFADITKEEGAKVGRARCSTTDIHPNHRLAAASIIEMKTIEERDKISTKAAKEFIYDLVDHSRGRFGKYSNKEMLTFSQILAELASSYTSEDDKRVESILQGREDARIQRADAQFIEEGYLYNNEELRSLELYFKDLPSKPDLFVTSAKRFPTRKVLHHFATAFPGKALFPQSAFLELESAILKAGLGADQLYMNKNEIIRLFFPGIFESERLRVAVFVEAAQLIKSVLCMAKEPKVKVVKLAMSSGKSRANIFSPSIVSHRSSMRSITGESTGHNESVNSPVRSSKVRIEDVNNSIQEQLTAERRAQFANSILGSQISDLARPVHPDKIKGFAGYEIEEEVFTDMKLAFTAWFASDYGSITVVDLVDIIQSLVAADILSECTPILCLHSRISDAGLSQHAEVDAKILDVIFLQILKMTLSSDTLGFKRAPQSRSLHRKPSPLQRGSAKFD